MELSYQVVNGYEYAKIPGTSVRENGKIRKKNVVYLGKVIDKEHHVFFNRQRGMFTYNPETGVYGTADADYISTTKKDGRKKERLVLDYGDASAMTKCSTVSHIRTGTRCMQWCSIIYFAAVPTVMPAHGMMAALHECSTQGLT